jgi:hypothetical protein
MDTEAMEAIAAFCDKSARTTLTQFRALAAKEFNGTCSDGIRVQAGQRVAIFVCLTGQHEIEKLQRVLSFPAEPMLDWSTLTLVEVFMRATANPSGLTCEVERDAQGRPTSIILVAVKPQSIQLIESALHLQD